jgi:RNA polymerase sigma factor (TIGR02999 family)
MALLPSVWLVSQAVSNGTRKQLRAGELLGILTSPWLEDPGMESDPPATQEASSNTVDVRANERLFASLYDQLRQLAARQLRRNAGVPVSPTTLLHEAYLGMADRNGVFPDQNRFMGYAARVMRGLIIDFIRERRALKRGGAFHITQLSSDIQEPALDEAKFMRLSAALDELAGRDPRLAEVVDLRYFCGFTFDEIAAQRGVSKRTVQRDWEIARIILFEQLTETP